MFCAQEKNDNNDLLISPVVAKLFLKRYVVIVIAIGFVVIVLEAAMVILAVISVSVAIAPLVQLAAFGTADPPP